MMYDLSQGQVVPLCVDGKGLKDYKRKLEKILMRYRGRVQWLSEGKCNTIKNLLYIVCLFYLHRLPEVFWYSHREASYISVGCIQFHVTKFSRTEGGTVSSAGTDASYDKEVYQLIHTQFYTSMHVYALQVVK